MMSDSPDADLMNIFRDEVSEYLNTLNKSLLHLETGATDMDLLRELNRIAHSMKGASRAVGITAIEGIAHQMESIFDLALRDELALTPAVCDLLYDALDMIQIAIHGEDLQHDAYDTLLSQLIALLTRPALAPPDKRLTPQEVPPIRLSEPDPHAHETQTLVLRAAEESIRVPVDKLDQLMAQMSELLVARMQHEERQKETLDLRRAHTHWRREWQAVRAAYVRLSRRAEENGQPPNDDLRRILRFLEGNQRQLLENSHRIAQLVQTLAQDSMRLNTLVDQLQDDIGGMRLVPFESLAGNFQRVIRDLARDTDKQVLLHLEGMHVEVDKTVLDTLKDPLMHLLRNAVDHGIEMPALRERIGKSPTGHVIIAIEQRGSEIIVTVRDDGGGINPDRVRNAAVRARLFTPSEAAAISDEDIRSYIFHPGLTTLTTVTAISGRGIGMDVVRDRVESLRGQVSVQSTPGLGTLIHLRVPVSLTRMRCVLLRLGGQRYAVPSAVVARMLWLDSEAIFTAENRDMVILENQPAQFVRLADVLHLPAAHSGSAKIMALVLRAADRTVAFGVDELESEQELVLKSLGPEIAQARYVSGAALLGTGETVLVLDANDLVRSATGTIFPRRVDSLPPTTPENRLRVLVVDDSITTRTLEKNILETAGFAVTVAVDGREAWHLLNDNTPFDVIVSDVEMPNLDGLALTRQVKADARTRHIPVILLTSLNKPEQREAGLQAGADAYLVKSQFDQDELLRLIQAIR